MRSLFVRIFLSFWIAVTLIGAGFALVYASREPGAWLQRGRFLMGQALRLHALNVAELEAEGHPDEAVEATVQLEERTRIRAYLVSDGEVVVAAGETPPEVLDLARQADETGESVWRDTSTIDYFAEPLTAEGLEHAVIVGVIPHPPSWVRFLGRDTLAWRLLIVFAVSGLVAWGLTRQLTRPIGKLREATRALAEEKLDVRVAPALGRRQDEIGALGRDFDVMADRIETLLDSQRRLLRDVSHELRSPLARLGVALELARQADPADADELFGRIEREADRLNDLIGQVLNVAQIDERSTAVQREPVDLAELVRQVVADADFEGRSRNRRVELGLVVPVVVQGVEEILRRAVENVVRNAVRFTDEGTSVEVSVERAAGSAAAQAVIRVRDHGPGVPDDALERIFQPFVRIGEARDRKSGGTGIGLAVARRAVAVHDGTIEAKNAEGGGLVVTIALPAG